MSISIRFKPITWGRYDRNFIKWTKYIWWAKGKTIAFGTHQFVVMRTPGHSHGSVLFYCEAEKTVFTGDTLFRMSIGRTDFPEGNWKEMEQSLHNVVARLPQDTLVLPGHGPKTSIADELRYNPYLR